MARSESVVKSSKSEIKLRTACEGCGEKFILQPLSRAAEAARQILRDETSGKIRGILAASAADGTASLFMVAERVGFEPTVRFPAHTLSKRAP